MCGLSGVLKKTYLTSDERKAFIELGSLSFFRGTDSTGVCVFTKKKPTSPKVNFSIKKSTDHAVDFFRRKDVLSEIHNNKAVCLMGHARAATHGTVNEINAQPMREGSIIGTHNGVLRKYEPNKIEEDFFTDSRKLFEAFDKTEVFKVLDGLFSTDSYALVWADTEYNTVNFIRNDRRPLYLCKSKNKALFWSSDAQMIEFALVRNNIEYERIVSVDEGVMLSVNLQTGVSSTKKYKEKETSTPFTYRRVVPSVQVIQSVVTHPITPTGVTKPHVFRDVPNGELATVSNQMAKSHSAMQEFMNMTARNYVKGSSGLIDDDNVVPFAPRTMQENDALVKDAERKEKEDTTSYDFLKRPGISDAQLHDLEQATYKLRKHGIPVWVSAQLAQSYLKCGCASCSAKPSVSDTVYWKDPSNYLCEECYGDENIKDYLKSIMRWPVDDLVESDVIVETRHSFYGG